MSAELAAAAEFAAAQERFLKRQEEITNHLADRLDAITEKEKKDREKQERIEKEAKEKKKKEKRERLEKEADDRKHEEESKEKAKKKKSEVELQSPAKLNDDMPFKCSVCNKGFSLNTCRSRHYKEQHTSKGLYCEFCAKKFRTSDKKRLESHHRMCKLNPLHK